MKVLKLALCVMAFSALSRNAVGQATNDEYYVTIGVFAIQDNAVRYTAKANKMGFSAQYAINAPRKLHYVYLLQTEEKRKAYAFLIKLRAESEFKDAWLFLGHLGTDAMVEVKVEPIIPPTVEIKDSVISQPPVVKVDSPVVKPVVKKVHKGKFFIFQFVNGENGNLVRGEIHFTESEKATQYQAFKADELIDLPAPRNTAGVFFITTVAPGFRALQTDFNYKDALPVSSGTGPDGELIVPLKLTRAKRGDYIEFNNVTYYRNSVVMQPQSQAELDGLADLMKENLNYKVRIHGHCNGTEARDIITLGTSAKYFENDPGNLKKRGSGKELSELRAEAVRRYLVSQGVVVDRMLTKGEGGGMMVYPQNSVYANYNDRVEIEIIRH